MLAQRVFVSTLVVFLCSIFLVGEVVIAGVPLQRYEMMMRQQSQELGLYNSSDKVVILTETNFKSMVLQQNHTSLVEFYNSYCGHCKRFAPFYKELAAQLYPWRDVLKVCAIDCAAEENNDICREYEVMSYPTLRYFGLDYQASTNNYGKPVETQDLNIIRSTMAQWVAAENQTSESHSWPNFVNLNAKEAENPFENLSSTIEYIVLIAEAENSTLGIETILFFQRYPTVSVRRVTDPDIAAKFKLDETQYKISIIDRKHSAVPYSALEDTSKTYKDIIESFLKSQHVTEKPGVIEILTTPSLALQAEYLAELADKKEILKEVHSNKHLVYQADLEMAVRSTLFNEIPKVSNISGERLLALQRFLAVLKRYNPLGASGRSLVSGLYEFATKENENLSGEHFEAEVSRLERQYQPVFSANQFVGCAASKSGLRGFTCSLWQLFHHFTVQAATSEESQDPLEVLQAIHGYVKYFFGCGDCAEHFQLWIMLDTILFWFRVIQFYSASNMATRRKIWSTPNKDDAILWLWAAHNEVNQRLAGDLTEDPEFPKIQFPSQSSCTLCYKQPLSTLPNLDINWDKEAVLSFLKNIHNPEYVSRYGVENEQLLGPTLDKLRQKRLVGNVFTDIDMRMGMLLYGFCIVMMVIAFKLFAFKGYRKKTYGHDILGKV